MKQNWFQKLSAEEKRRMAQRLGTSIDWLYQLSGSHGKASAKLANAIHDYSAGQWSKHELRPDIFGVAAEVS